MLMPGINWRASGKQSGGSGKQINCCRRRYGPMARRPTVIAKRGPGRGCNEIPTTRHSRAGIGIAQGKCPVRKCLCCGGGLAHVAAKLPQLKRTGKSYTGLAGLSGKKLKIQRQCFERLPLTLPVRQIAKEKNGVAHDWLNFHRLSPLHSKFLNLFP